MTGTLFNYTSGAITVPYDVSTVSVPAFGKKDVADKDLVGDLPAGVQLYFTDPASGFVRTKTGIKTPPLPGNFHVATGDAVPADVRSGKKFSSRLHTNATGTATIP